MTETPTSPRPEPARREKLGSRILIGILAGIACGVFLGELSRPFEVLGEVYIGLLQMTVLPYVAAALVTNIGSMTFGDAKGLAGRAGLVMLGLWVISLAAVAAMPLSLPEREAGSFFSASLVDKPEDFDFLGLYLPINPFQAFANNVVPAVVLFSILIGAATVAIPNKDRLIGPLSVFVGALRRISNGVVSLSPYGVFALSAGAAGTLSPGALVEVSGYVITYTIAVLFVAIVVLPGFVAVFSPYPARLLLVRLRGVLLTGFATGKLFAVLAMLTSAVRDFLVERGVPDQEARDSADMLVPLAYPFPGGGKILVILFVPWAGWFVGQPLEPGDYPLLLTAGLLSLFGSPIVAMAFLLDLFRLPVDLLALFILSGIWCSRIGEVLGVTHLAAFALISDAWNRGVASFSLPRLARWLVTVALGGFAVVAANLFVVGAITRGLPDSADLVTGWEPYRGQNELVELSEAAPNPESLRPGETRRQRALRTGTLRVGFVRDNPPFSYHNRHGRPVGLDLDLAQELAADLQVSLTLVPYDPPQLAAALDADHFDLACGGIASTIDSFGKYRETASYLRLNAAIVVPDYRASEFLTFAQISQMKEVRLGCIEGGFMIRRARRDIPGLQIVTVPSAEEFLSGRTTDVDVLLTTAETGSIYCMLFPEFSVVVPDSERINVPLVFVVPEEGEFSDLVGTWIELKSSDGTIEALYDYWILGRQPQGVQHRWSVIQNVLGLVK